MLLRLLKGIGTAIYEVEGVKWFLQSLMEQWIKYHLGYDNQREKLTSSEVDSLCLLLEVCKEPISAIFFINWCTFCSLRICATCIGLLMLHDVT
jgi:hypothetical protein